MTEETTNTGNWNTGNWNTGDRNTGHWNTGDRNTGYCNTITPEEVLIFNKLCSIKKWEKASKPDWMPAKINKGFVIKTGVEHVRL